MKLRVPFLGTVARVLALLLACCCGDPARAGERQKTPEPPEQKTPDAADSGTPPSEGEQPRFPKMPRTLKELSQVDRTAITKIDRPWVPRKYEVEISYSLEEAIREGLLNSLAVRSSDLDRTIQERELIVAHSVFDPFFNLATNYAKNRQPTVSTIQGSTAGISVAPSKIFDYSAGFTGTWITGSQYQISVGQVRSDVPAQQTAGFTTLNPVVSTQLLIEVQQPLLKGAWYSVNTADIRIAENNTLLASKELELTAINTIFQIEQAYWDLVFATQNLEAKLNTFRVSLENLENVRKRKAVGTLAAIHVTTAESQAALRRVELDEARQLQENNRDAFLNVINYANQKSLKQHWQGGPSGGTYENVRVICTTDPVSEAEMADRDAALGLAFNDRPEYRQIELNLQNQQIRIEVARNALLPSLDVTAGWAQSGLDEHFGDSWDSVGSGDFYDWQVGLQFSIPLGNRGPRNSYRNSRDELRKIRLSKVDLENQIVIEVDQAIRTIEYLTETVKDLDERVRLQTALLAAEVRKVDVGMSIAYTVSVIANDLVDNQTQALRARTNLQIAIADYYRATGRLLQRYNVGYDFSRDR